MAAVLSCGSEALLGYRSAAVLWGILERAPATIEIVVPSNVARRQPGIRVHRRAVLRPEDRDARHDVPVTTPAATIIDCASQIVRSAGLPIPQTQVRVNGFRVDFYWRDLGLVVETDGLRYHRTSAQQARDLEREQVHTAAGLTALRFAGSQIHDEPSIVLARLASVIERLDPSEAEGSSPLEG